MLMPSAANQQLPTSSGNRAPPLSAAPRSIQNGYEGSRDLLTNEDDNQRSINEFNVKHYVTKLPNLVSSSSFLT